VRVILQESYNYSESLQTPSGMTGYRYDNRCVSNCASSSRHTTRTDLVAARSGTALPTSDSTSPLALAPSSFDTPTLLTSSTVPTRSVRHPRLRTSDRLSSGTLPPSTSLTSTDTPTRPARSSSLLPRPTRVWGSSTCSPRLNRPTDARPPTEAPESSRSTTSGIKTLPLCFLSSHILLLCFPIPPLSRLLYS
jgi:hypothetical protein